MRRRTAGLDSCQVRVGDWIAVIRPSTRKWTYAAVLPPKASLPNAVLVDFRSEKGAAYVPIGTTIGRPTDSHIIFPGIDVRGVEVKPFAVQDCILAGYAASPTPAVGGFGPRRQQNGRFADVYRL